MLFGADDDYRAFFRVLAEGHETAPMRTSGYCVMPKGRHLVLWPRADGDLSGFIRWLTVTHTQRWPHPG